MKPPTDNEKQQFIDEMTMIMKKNPKVDLECQLEKWQNHRFRLMTSRDKIEFLDHFSSEQQNTLKSLWRGFKKFIDPKSIVTSVKITSEWAEKVANPFEENDEKKVAGQETKKHYIKFHAEIGRYITLMEEGAVEPFKKYQLWIIQFSLTEQCCLYSKRYVKNADPDEDWPTFDNPEVDKISTNNFLHVASEFIDGFINTHEENLVDELYVDVKMWASNGFPIKFKHVRKLDIVHNGPNSTYAWLNRVDTMKSIDEVTIHRSYNGKDGNEATFRETHPFVRHEAFPFVIHFEDDNMSRWSKTSHCKNPILWAETLTFQTIIENRLTDLARMCSLREINMNRMALPKSELNEFLRMWISGDLGHRLVRVNIQLDCPTDFSKPEKMDFVQCCGKYVGINQELFAGVAHLNLGSSDLLKKLSDKLKESVKLKDTGTFVIYRDWRGSKTKGKVDRRVSESSGYYSDKTPPSTGASTPPLAPIAEAKEASPAAEAMEKLALSSAQTSSTLSHGQPAVPRQSPRTISHSSDSSSASASSGQSRVMRWIGGSCAILHIQKKNVSFTAVRNEQFAEELLSLRQNHSKPSMPTN